MSIQICSCEGLNPKCEKCFGSGYINSATKRSDVPKEKTAAPVKSKSVLPEDISGLSRKEAENLCVKIAADLDVKSKKQMQILNAIPFSTSTFRRDFKDKFQNLAALENQKKAMWDDLNRLADELLGAKFLNNLRFGHYLSDKEIDVSSNRQLKTLIREYRKQKGESRR